MATASFGRNLQPWLPLTYHVGALASFVKLTFFDGVTYNWWNWFLLVPIQLFLAEIWPIYWLLIRPFSGHVSG